MRGVVALLLLAVALLSCPASASNVVQLNDDNFEEEVGKVALMLVKFYAPWCGHCQHMSAAFEEAADELHDQVTSSKLAEVDATVATAVAAKYGVQGFPTIKLFESGKESKEYSGDRTRADLVAFVKKAAAETDEGKGPEL